VPSGQDVHTTDGREAARLSQLEQEGSVSMQPHPDLVGSREECVDALKGALNAAVEAYVSTTLASQTVEQLREMCAEGLITNTQWLREWLATYIDALTRTAAEPLVLCPHRNCSMSCDIVCEVQMYDTSRA